MTPYFAQDGVTLARWRGKPCSVVGFQDITTSAGTVKRCAEIKLTGIPLFQGWRLVDAAEVEMTQRPALTKPVKAV